MYVFTVLCMLQDLPGAVQVEQQEQLAAIQETTKEGAIEEEQMKIAWRYQNQPKVQVNAELELKMSLFAS